MNLATRSQHDPNCSGCPACDDAMAYILDHPNEPRPRLVSASGQQIPQPAFRAAVARWAAQREDERDGVPAPPDMNAMIRAASGKPPAAPVLRAATFDVEAVPPAISFDEMNAWIRATRGAR